MAKAGLTAEVLTRRMAAQELGLPGAPRLLEAVAGSDGRLRLFFGDGSDVAGFAPGGAGGGAVPETLRAAAGGVILVARGTGPVALAAGRLQVAAVPDETALFAGLDCTVGFRLAETAAQLAEGLRWHAALGLQGAVIVNRAPDGSEKLARPLRRALAGLSLRVLLLDCPLPLGKPGLGPLTHATLAPDAPGKDRMTAPDPDPWLAPLAEGLVLEAVKARFLRTARTVLLLEACDRLAAGPNPFDACAEAPGGVILLAGEAAYPWRLRAGQEARFADHICRLFDGQRSLAAWGIAPAKAGSRLLWRMGRIAGPQPAPALPFWRAMALRVPGHATPDLAPKAALVEDPALLDWAAAQGHAPIRPPVSAPRAADPGHRTAIVTTMKNEGPFILEWLAYHRVIGVDDFLIYTNDCTDGTDAMLEMLQHKGLVQHRDNPYRAMDLKPQHAALQAAEDEPVMRNCGWGICMDVDEFINIRLGDGTLGALYAAMGSANMISLTWRLFGNGGVEGYADRPVTEQFTRCAPEVIRKPHQAWGFKTLFRNMDLYRKLGVHRPKGLRPDLWEQVDWRNGSGQPMPKAMFRTGWRSTLETYGYDWVQLNHYAVRSAESFLVKRDRGRVNHVDRDQGLNYWFRMNHNAAEDRSIQRMIPRLRAEMDRLLADPDIRAAHDHAVGWHRGRIAALRAAGEPAALHAELTSARMQRLCTLQRHFGSAVFLAGPGVIPPDLPLDDLPPDFFFTVEHNGEAEH